MSSPPRIFGWQPTKSEDHVEISPCPIPPRPSTLRIFTYKSSKSNESQSPHTSPAGYEAQSPASSNSSLSLEGGFQSDQYSEPAARRGDPAWVARPRNPFIIFRCEYSREHSKAGKRVRRPPGSAIEKTLSKRAAEAWHQLSAVEKDRFKQLADEEREEHARLYPNYRFRPMKRVVTKKRNQSASKIHSKAPRSPSAVDSLITAPILRHPLPPDTPEPSLSPPVDMAAVKAGRRRSASAPSLPLGQNPFTSWATPPRGLEMKRSRSLMGVRPPPLHQTYTRTQYEGQSFDPKLRENSTSEDYAPNEPFGRYRGSSPGGYPFPAPEHYGGDYSPALLSPLSAVASTLSGWNGEVISADALLSPTSWVPTPPTSFDGHPFQPYAEYLNLGHFECADALENYASNDPWMPSPHDYPLTMNEVNSSAELFAPSYASLAENTYALQEYGLGLEAHAVETSEDAMLALDPNDYFQAY